MVMYLDGDGRFTVMEFGVSPRPETSFGINVQAVMCPGGKVMPVFGGRVVVTGTGYADVGLSDEDDDGNQAGD